MDRRAFLGNTGTWAALAAVARVAPVSSAAAPRPHIVLRSSWQTVNIGDIAHTPGALTLLERYVPEARVTLWPRDIGANVQPMLERRFPKVAIYAGKAGEERRLDGTPLEMLLTSADLVMHGSAANVASPDMLYAARALSRPYGVYGVTLTELSGQLKDAAGAAQFFFCRETSSLAYLKELALPCPVQEFAPDATFAIDLRDDARAKAYLEANKLKKGEFLCVIPRLRWTPYPRILDAAAKGDADAKDKLATNDRFVETDCAKLREAIIAWVRETKHKVLLCPEMTYEVAMLRPHLYDKLPDDVKPSVVVKDTYWLTDEAASTYAWAAAVLSCEMHSPIIALANGTPAIYVRQPTDTRKGQMWRDIGLPEWIFEIDEVDGPAIASQVLSLARDRRAVKGRVKDAMKVVRARQEASMAVVRRTCGLRA